MTLKDDLDKYVKDTLGRDWTHRAGQVVPKLDSVGLGNDGVDLDAVILYADLADSTELVKNQSAEFAGEIYKTYLYLSDRIIRDNNGVITAYDGDRVMAVYLGDGKNTSAAATALRINWAVVNILQPALDEQYPELGFKVRQKIGIDASKVMVARTGMRGNNELVWVGTAANNAAKLAARSTAYPSYISEAVYKKLAIWPKYSKDKKIPMWQDLGIGDQGFRVYGSTWRSTLA